MVIQALDCPRQHLRPIQPGRIRPALGLQQQAPDSDVGGGTACHVKAARRPSAHPAGDGRRWRARPPDARLFTERRVVSVAARRSAADRLTSIASNAQVSGIRRRARPVRRHLDQRIAARRGGNNCVSAFFTPCLRLPCATSGRACGRLPAYILGLLMGQFADRHAGRQIGDDRRRRNAEPQNRAKNDFRHGRHAVAFAPMIRAMRISAGVSNDGPENHIYTPSCSFVPVDAAASRMAWRMRRIIGFRKADKAPVARLAEQRIGA